MSESKTLTRKELKQSYVRCNHRRPMTGSGVWDTVKKYGSKVAGVYSGELATAIKNALPSNDNTGATQYAGENHAIVKLPNGKMGIANFLGNGTKVLKRVRKGDKPRNKTDAIARRHDIAYSLALNSDGSVNTDKVRDADNRMISSLENAERKKEDHPVNIKIAKNLMKAKVLAEDLNLIKKDRFVGKTHLNPEDTKLLEEEMKKMEQEGYGMSKLEKIAFKEAKKLEGKGIGLSRTGEGIGLKRTGEGLGLTQAGAGALLDISKKLEELTKAKLGKKGVLEVEEIMKGKGKSKDIVKKYLNVLNKRMFKGKLSKKMFNKMGKPLHRLMRGKGGWDDFVDSFKYGFNAGANIVSPIVRLPKIPDAPDSYEALTKKIRERNIKEKADSKPRVLKPNDPRILASREELNRINQQKKFAPK